MPAHHDVRAERRGAAPAARRRWPRPPIAGPTDFAELLLDAGRRRAHRARAGHGGRGGARRALPLHRSGAVLARAWRQGPASRSRCRCKVYDETIGVLKSAVRKAKLGRDEELARDQAAGRPGAAGWSGTPADRPCRGADRRGAGALAALWRPQGLRGRAATGGEARRGYHRLARASAASAGALRTRHRDHPQKPSRMYRPS